MSKFKIQTQAKGKTILACDPSLRAWGWAIINFDSSVVRSGCIMTEPLAKKTRIRVSDDFTRRVHEISTVLFDVIKEYNVSFIVIETPHGSQNAAAAKMVGAVPSIIETFSVCLGISVEWYSEEDSKKEILHKKSATKTEMVDAIIKLFPDAILPKNKAPREAVADALAVYYTATKQSTTLKFLRNENYYK